jgi:hypothetical protein
MRDWKVFSPNSGSSTATGSTPQQLMRKRQSSPDDPLDANPPQFEIALDMNADQLTLMFEDADKYEQRGTHTPTNDVDHQEAWRREALRAKSSPAESFGPWSDESHFEGSTYFRKATRLS